MSNSLTVEIVNEMRAKYKTGKISFSSLAKDYNTTKSICMNAVKGITWKNATEAPISSGASVGRPMSLVQATHPKTKEAIRKLVNMGYASFEIVAILINNGSTMPKKSMYRNILNITREGNGYKKPLINTKSVVSAKYR